MNAGGAHPLLATEDAPPVGIVNPGGAAAFLLIGDHAGNAVPAALDALGLDDAERTRHIAWDIGIRALGEALSTALDAVFIHQRYSRLVIDCNRAPGAVDSIAETSDLTRIPGNQALSAAAKAARAEQIHEPYQRAIAAEIARRDAAGMETILIALHSFTPSMQGATRPWQIGVLHDGGDATFAQALLDVLRQDDNLAVGDNEPYRMDQIDYTIPRHAYPSRRRYAEIEIRQDLLVEEAQVASWTALLTATLAKAAGRGAI